MITIEPAPRALVPVDSAAADALGAPNYDEFQGDREIYDLLQAKPDSVLRVTMAHCDAASPDSILEADSEASLERAAANMASVVADPRTRELQDVLWICEISGPRRPGVRQIGLGGLARTAEIRTPQHRNGPVIRNEGIRESKAKGRARLIQRIGAIVDGVNNAVDDASGLLQRELEHYADATAPSFQTTDEAGWLHRIWIVQDTAAIERLRSVLAREPHAYVADGNHRSAAAAMLGYAHYMAVFFPARTMHISPYNRLVSASVGPVDVADAALGASFAVEPYTDGGAFQPVATHEIGLYDGRAWWRLRPRPGTYDPGDAAQDIDADIVQRRLFRDVFGISDARDERLTFVGGNRSAAWLQANVDAGEPGCAITLPAVTMDQFIRVCMQDRLMPPKSTWFEPKLRSGLIMALLNDAVAPWSG